MTDLSMAIWYDKMLTNTNPEFRGRCVIQPLSTTALWAEALLTRVFQPCMRALKCPVGHVDFGAGS